jgi:hypothetical protein
MPLNEQSFTVFTTGQASISELRAFAELPPDAYCGGAQRYRRFSQYRLSCVAGRWVLGILPHRAFLQSRKYNWLVGNVPRQFQPLLFDPSEKVSAAAGAIGLDGNVDWQVNAHQCRVIVSPSVRGICTPEGPHRDGHEFGVIAVASRHSIVGGETVLLPPTGGTPFFRKVLSAGEAVAFVDGRMLHHTSEIFANGESGHRDLWILAINRWDERRYGPEFEQKILQETQ